MVPLFFLFFLVQNWHLSKSFACIHVPMLGCQETDLRRPQWYVVHVPSTISSLVKMIVLSLPFYPWTFAWHSHANEFGFHPLVLSSCIGSLCFLILFSPSSTFNIRNVPTWRFIFIKSRLKMTFKNGKVLWIKFVPLVKRID